MSWGVTKYTIGNALLGPKGAGKSTTLLKAFHCAQREGKNAIYIDAKCCKDPNYDIILPILLNILCAILQASSYIVV